MVASLTRRFGIAHLDLAEDVVQEALGRALALWPFRGIPDDPAAWLAQVAHNRAIDGLRRDRRFAAKAEDVRFWLSTVTITDAPGAATFAKEISDDQLALIFACCHPSVPRSAQIALTLKTVGGFSTAEIANAYLVKEATVAQRIVRAKRELRERSVSVDMPAPPDIALRLDAVLESIYLMFNEGYAAQQGVELIRRDVCDEALRLAVLVADHPIAGRPEANALAALLFLLAARFPARVDADGDILVLAEQDRKLWDPRLTDLGVRRLPRAAAGPSLTRYHLLAAIAGCHAQAGNFEATDWHAILGYYDLLLELTPSPVIELNRAVAVAMVHDAASGLAIIDRIRCDPALAAYYLLPATEATLLRRAGRHEDAQAAFERALALAKTEPVRRLLRHKLD